MVKSDTKKRSAICGSKAADNVFLSTLCHGNDTIRICVAEGAVNMIQSNKQISLRLISDSSFDW